MTARRGKIVRVHRWLSFLLMLWIVVESLSGAGIVFAGELDRVWNSDQFETTTGDVGMPAAIAAAREVRPDNLVRFATAAGADEAGGVYWVWMTDPSGEYHSVLVDPGSGRVTSADHKSPLLIGWLESIHYNLNSTSIFGVDPLKVMGWLAIGWLVILIAGFYLWYWPGIRRWATAARVRRRRGKFTFHLDLHKALGIIAVVPLTVVVITGINFAFPDEVRSVWNAVTFGSYEQPDTQATLSVKTPGVKSITTQQAIDAVTGIDPTVEIQYVTGPGGSPIGIFDVEALVDSSFLGSVGGQRTVEFSVDQYSGGIVAIEDPADKGFASTAYDDWSYQVHFGTFGGTTTKVLWVLLGLTPLLLAVTGTRMWFIRRSKRNRRAATSTPSESLDPAITPGATS